MCSCGELTHICLILQAKSSTLLPTTAGYTMNAFSVKILQNIEVYNVVLLYKGNCNRVQNDINYSSNKLNHAQTDNQKCMAIIP